MSGPVGTIILAQTLSAGSELLAQRLSRRVHRGSGLRLLASMSLYCCAQAAVLLGLCEALLPPNLSGGQGPLYLLARLLGVLTAASAGSASDSALMCAVALNAIVNAGYWLGVARLLAEPLGPLLVVLAFLCAAFGVGELQAVTGLLPAGAPAPTVPLDAAVAGALGALLAVAEAPQIAAAATLVVKSCGRQNSMQAVPSEDPDSASASSPSVAGAGWLHTMSVLAAFTCVAGTSSVSIVLATWFEARGGLTSLGFLSADQLLLPLSVLPLIALLEAVPFLRRATGEPRWSADAEASGGLSQTLARTWEELRLPPEPMEDEVEEKEVAAAAAAAAAGPLATSSAGAIATSAAPLPQAAPTPLSSTEPSREPYRAPGILTLAGFHGLELLRAAFFFYLVTKFDAETTYLLMTLCRIALVAVASLLACTLLRRWVGLLRAEADAATAPASLALRATGIAGILFAVLRIKGVI